MTPTQQNWLKGILATLLGVLCFLHLHYCYPWFFSLDDAYIVLHSAQALHLGYDPNYLGTPPLAGNTSPVYLALVFLACYVLPPLYASAAISWLAIFLYAFGVLTLAILMRASLIQTIALLIIALLTGNTIFQLFDGVETGLMMASITWALILVILPPTKKYRLLLSLLLGTLPFVRPELALLSFALFIYQFKRCGGQVFRQDIFWILLAASPWLIWMWQQMRALYPTTMLAKKVFFAVAYPSITAHLNTFFSVLAFFFWHTGIFLLPLFALLSLSALGETLLIFVLTLLAIYYFNGANLLITNECRYLFILLPIFIYAGLANIHAASKQIRSLANFCLMIAALQACLFLPSHWQTYREETKDLSHSFSNYTTWCLQHIPKTETIAIQDAGYLAFATPFHLIDIVGLKTPRNIAIHQALTFPGRGNLRIQAISQILVKNKVRYLIVTKDWDEGANISNGLRQLGWKVQLMKTAEYPSKKNAYLIYTLVGTIGIEPTATTMSR